MVEYLEFTNGTYRLKKSLNENMKVEPILYVNHEIIEPLLKEHEERAETSTFTQLSNISSLPTILSVSSLPDVHCGYSFPIGTSAGFDLQNEDCIVSVEGVGHDINCGVRSIATNLTIDDIMRCQENLAQKLYEGIPTGLTPDPAFQPKNPTKSKKASETKQSSKNTSDSSQQQSSEMDGSKISSTTDSNENNPDSPSHAETITSVLQNMPFENNKTQFPQFSAREFNEILDRGVQFLVEKKLADPSDLDLIENRGSMNGNSKKISQRAKARGLNQIGSLGSGNHYLEIQKVTDIYDESAARLMNIHSIGQIIITIHTGSRGLGFQTCEDFNSILKKIAHQKSLDAGLQENSKKSAKQNDGKEFIDPEYKDSVFIEHSQSDQNNKNYRGHLRFHSKLGKDYYSGMCSAANFAFCNRALIDFTARKIFRDILPDSKFNLIYDVCHNIAKIEKHILNGIQRDILVHRKGASRAFPPNHPDIPMQYKNIGQPVLVGGSMGTCSYILVGGEKSIEKTLGSACHGAGRILSRSQSNKTFTFDEIQEILSSKGIIVKCASKKGLVEEAPGSYKNVDVVVDICEQHEITKKIIRVEPVIVIKG